MHGVAVQSWAHAPGLQTALSRLACTQTPAIPEPIRGQRPQLTGCQPAQRFSARVMHFQMTRERLTSRGPFGARGVGQAVGSEVRSRIGLETETAFTLGHLLSSLNWPGLWLLPSLRRSLTRGVFAPLMPEGSPCDWLASPRVASFQTLAQEIWNCFPPQLCVLSWGFLRAGRWWRWDLRARGLTERGPGWEVQVGPGPVKPSELGQGTGPEKTAQQAQATLPETAPTFCPK